MNVGDCVGDYSHTKDHQGKGPQHFENKKRKFTAEKNIDVHHSRKTDNAYDGTLYPKASPRNDPAILVRTLQYQGILEMGEHGDITVKYSNLLKGIYDSMRKRVTDQRDHNPEHIDEIEKSLEKAKCCLGRAFFGGLGVIYSRNKGKFPKSYLMNEGFLFLESFLGEWNYIPLKQIKVFASVKHKFDNSTSQTPMQLFGYMMSLKNSTNMSYQSLLLLMRIFKKRLNQKGKAMLIIFQDKTFTEDCWTFRWTRDCIYQVQFGHSYDHSRNCPHNQNCTKHNSKPGVSMQSMLNVHESNSPQNTCDFTIRRGKQVLNSLGSLEGEVKRFFDQLESELITSCQILSPEQLRNLNEQVKKQAVHKCPPRRRRIKMVAKNMFRKLIHLAHYHITPMLMESMKVYHNHQRKFETLELSQRDGWRFLQQYFLSFVNSLALTKGGYHSKSRVVDWSNIQEVIHYLLTWGDGKRPPYLFVRYLCDQWANQL